MIGHVWVQSPVQTSKPPPKTEMFEICISQGLTYRKYRELFTAQQKTEKSLENGQSFIMLL